MKRFKSEDSSSFAAAAIEQKSKWEENKSQLEIQLSRIEDQLRENESRSRDVQLASRTPCSYWSNQDNVAFANDCQNKTASLDSERIRLLADKSSIVRRIQALQDQILRSCW